MVGVETLGNFVTFFSNTWYTLTWQFCENVKLVTIRVIGELAEIYCCENRHLCCTGRLHEEERFSKIQKDSC